MQRLIFTLLITFFTLEAKSFSKIYTTVTAVDANSITLATPLPYSGMSALVLRQTPAGEYALVYLKVTQNRGVVIDKDPLGGNPLATIKPTVKVGDSVIGGFLYNRALVLAPTKELEQKAKSVISAQSVDPQLFKTYLASSGKSATGASYKEFAKLLGIGVILLADESGVNVYDPISQTVITRVSF